MHTPICIRNKFQHETERRKMIVLSIIVRRRKAKKYRSTYVRDLFKQHRYHGEYFMLKDLEEDPLYHKKYFR